MNTGTLKNIFKAPYQSSVWKSFLKQLFGNSMDASYFQSPIDLKDNSLVKHKDVEHIWEFGDIVLSDGKTIKFYEIVLKENQQVTKNRVGLRNILSSEIVAGYIDGAIITYHNHKASDWRFTFISKSLYWDEDNNEVKTETHPKRYTYLLGQNETVKTAVTQFEWLFKQIQSREISMEDILKAFSVEKLSKEFYDGYFHQFETFVAYIVDNPKAFSLFTSQVSGNHEKAEKLVSDFVKKFLGRIVFLYFLQKKGWMGVPLDEDWGNGQRDFIFRLFEEFADKNNFYQKALVPLFFQTLNEDRSNNNDIFSVTNTRIPYLNGGLFEKDDTEPLDIQFEPQRFIDLFAFFSKYNFTVDESSPDDQDIGVDPEMLGHIFENLLEDNKDKGAFYTPKEIVHYMTQESLIEYLYTHLHDTNKEALTIFVKQKKKGKLSENELDEINALLNKLKICDPAIGSGAFPMGLLHEIFALKGLIAFEQGYEAWSPARVKERIIENSIYGVDIEEGAVDIARLRFWLSLVVDEPTPRPLPNLDYKIICGNSLISRYTLDTPINEVFKEFNKGREDSEKVDLEKYKALVRDYMHEANHDKKIEFKQLIEDIKTAFKTTFDKADKDKIAKARAKAYNLQQKDLLGKTLGSKKEITTAKKKLKKLEEQRNDIEEAKTFHNAVEWRFEFPNLLDTDGNFEGFDIVIGNPPYIQLQKDGGYLAKMLEPMQYKTFAKTGDIYCLFYEQSTNLLKNNGVISFITSDKWMLANYGKALRNYFIENITPTKLLSFGQGVFKSATVNTNILVGIKNKKEFNEFDICQLSSSTIRTLNEFVKNNSTKISFEKDEPWSILSQEEFAIKKQVESVGIPLKQWDVHIFRGILTGLNEAFIIDKDKVNELNPDDYNYEIIKPIIIGKELKRYSTSWSNGYLINSHNGIKQKNIPRIEIENYPQIKQHLDTFGSRLSKRADKGDTPYNLRNCAYIFEFEKPKIAWGNLAQRAQFAYVDEGFIINAPSPFITPANKYLLAVLNSKAGDFYIRTLGVKRNGGYFEYKPMFIEKLPVPQLSEEEQAPFKLIVDYILNLKSFEKQINEYVPNSHISETFEEVIDAMVFELYFPEDFKQAGISFINYAERDFESIEGKSEEEQREIIHNAYQKLQERNNEIRNNLKEMKIELRDLLMPIITA